MLRRRFKQTQSLEVRLAEEAKRLREEAKLLPPGAKRDEMIRKARQAAEHRRRLEKRRNFWPAARFLQGDYRNWMEDAAAPPFPFCAEPQIVPEDKRAMAEHRGECRVVRRQRAKTRPLLVIKCRRWLLRRRR